MTALSPVTRYVRSGKKQSIPRRFGVLTFLGLTQECYPSNPEIRFGFRFEPDFLLSSNFNIKEVFEYIAAYNIEILNYGPQINVLFTVKLRRPLKSVEYFTRAIADSLAYSWDLHLNRMSSVELVFAVNEVRYTVTSFSQVPDAIRDAYLLSFSEEGLYCFSDATMNPSMQLRTWLWRSGLPD